MSDPPKTPDDEHGQQKRKRTESTSSDLGVPSWVAGASPPRFVGLEELMKAAVNLDKMALAHEIVVDPDFQLNKTEPPDGTLEKKVHEVMHQVFWESLKEKMDKIPPDYEPAFTLLGEIKEILLSLLLPHHTRLKREIEENLDVALLRQQCEHECLDFMRVSTYIVSVMGRLCAPARDEKLAQLKQCKDIIPLFKGIFELLDFMKLDMANFTITSVRPSIVQNSIEYERQKFQDYLVTNPDGLRHTAHWMERAFSDCRDQRATPDAKRMEQEATASTSADDNFRSEINQIVPIAYWEVLEWRDDRAFPETLLVDQARLFDMRNRCLQLIITTCVIMITSNIAGRDVVDLPNFKNGLKERLLILLEDCEQRNLQSRLPGVAEQAVKEVNECLNQLNKSELDEKQRDAIKNQIKELLHITHPVRKLIRDRVRQFIIGVVATPTASPIKLPHGLTSVQSELAKLTGGFLRLVSHNRQVFSSYYDEMLLRQLRHEDDDNTENDLSY